MKAVSLSEYEEVNKKPDCSAGGRFKNRISHSKVRCPLPTCPNITDDTLMTRYIYPPDSYFGRSSNGNSFPSPRPAIIRGCGGGRLPLRRLTYP